MHKRRITERLLLVTSIVAGQGSMGNTGVNVGSIAGDSYTFLESVSKQGSPCFQAAFQSLKDSQCKDLSDDLQSRVSDHLSTPLTQGKSRWRYVWQIAYSPGQAVRHTPAKQTKISSGAPGKWPLMPGTRTPLSSLTFVSQSESHLKLSFAHRAILFLLRVA